MRRIFITLIVGLFGIALISGALFFSKNVSDVSALFPSNLFATGGEAAQTNTTRFVMDVYDTIDEYYFNDLPQETLIDFFSRGIERFAGEKPALATTTRDALSEAVEKTVTPMSRTQRETFAANVANLVLQSLPPQGRSGLYSEKRQEELRNTVNNVNPDRDLYATLGAEEGATSEQIAEAASVRKRELTQENTPEAQEEIERVEYAEGVLSDPENKERYDTVRAEPTVFIKRIAPDIVHLYIKRFSGATLDEFTEAAESIDAEGTEPSVLILDLRSNLGGAIDSMPQFLGPFIGPNANALEVLTQGARESIPTQSGWLDALVRYKQVVILIDDKAQSTAEVMASALKKYNVGTLVGKTTRGWGTIERLFPIEHQIGTSTKHSVFLVHTITLRDDGQPIEGNGVIPHVSIVEDAKWRDELFRYTRNESLVEVVNELWNDNLPGTF